MLTSEYRMEIDEQDISVLFEGRGYMNQCYLLYFATMQTHYTVPQIHWQMINSTSSSNCIEPCMDLFHRIYNTLYSCCTCVRVERLI